MPNFKAAVSSSGNIWIRQENGSYTNRNSTGNFSDKLGLVHQATTAAALM